MGKYLIISFTFLFVVSARAQTFVTIPWSTSLHITFGNGTVNPGSPLPRGYTDFLYTTNPVLSGGEYTVLRSTNDAGHIYFGPQALNKYTTGNKMKGKYSPLFTSKTVFRDTVRGLCSGTRYLFWAGINNAMPNTCIYPSFTFSVETTSGTVMASSNTGLIGAGLSSDNYSWYYGYYDRDPRSYPVVPFYGCIFQLPPGETAVVLKIVNNPSSSYYQCAATFEIDNINLMPVGPDVRIKSPKYPFGWITASCSDGTVPVEMNGRIESGYVDFGTLNYNYVQQSYSNPSFQWQQSLDDGFTWTDIPGETGLNISRNFNYVDTFWMRLRVSESGDMNNLNCSNVSNMIQVQVDKKPADFRIASNSPVCTDGDLKLTLAGGVKYNTFGPNGFFDDTPFPHIYHPALADSGWYYTEIITFGGCKATDSVFVKIIGPNVSFSGDRSICYGDTAHLQISGGVKYEWSPAAGLSNAFVANPVASPGKTTTYKIKATDSMGCNAYGETTIHLRDSVFKAMVEGPEIVCPLEGVSFRDNSIGEIISWYWDFGNGNTSIDNKPEVQHYPAYNGALFPVKLTVTDTAGCIKTIIKYIKTVTNCYIAVPTGFTPNNDGLNDFLSPLNAYKAGNLVFKVFDRWGKLVFETKDWTRKWDGTIQGVPQNTGVYLWTLSYTDADNKQVFLKGTSTLIR